MWKVVLGLVLVGVAAGTYWLQMGDSATSVDTATVKRGSIESSLQLTGKVINDRTVTLTALLDGEIMAIRAREGDVVKAGTVLAELDSRQARALLDKANAELVLQQQSVDAASRNYERTKLLYRVENTSEQALDDSLDSKLAAEASLQAARATLTLNKLRLDNALIRSPFDGTVIQQSAETGQWLEAGQPLFEVVATEGIVIETLVSATERDILLQFLLEAGLISVTGGVLGLLIGGLASVALALATGFPLMPSAVSIVGALVVSIVVGILSGYLPARRAAKMKPVDALNTQ